MALVVDRKTGEMHYLPLRRADDKLQGSLVGRQYAVPYVPGDDATSALASLASQLDRDGFEFHACDSCRWFYITGASHQQTDGWGGYCTIVALRNVRALVSPDYACLQWSALAGWPDDRARMQDDRLQALRSDRPDLRSNFAGCTLGLFLAAQKVGSTLGDVEPRKADVSQQLSQFLQVVHKAFEFIASHGHIAPAANDAVADQLFEALSPAESVWMLLSSAIPLGLLEWRAPQSTWRFIDSLADRCHATRSDRLAAHIATSLTGMALAKRPYNMILFELEKRFVHEGAEIEPVWRPWLAAARSGAAIESQAWQFPENDGAHLVAAAWYAWQHVGGLFNEAVRMLHDRHAIATAIAGALSGAVNGSAAISRDTEGEDADLQTWATLGERLFERANATRSG